MASAITIIHAASLEPAALDHVTGAVRNAFRLPVTVSAPPFDLERAYDTSRRQYHSTALLSHMIASHVREDGKFITVVNVDLFVPILTFVFGEAQFNGPAAIVSLTRLENRFYGVEHDAILLRRRLEKEIIHELGHTFGLYHCRQYDCVMRSSTYVEEIDLKRETFCDACRVALEKNVAG